MTVVAPERAKLGYGLGLARACVYKVKAAALTAAA
jgi:hypothetical protein